jgi:hypothetical protein
MIFNRDTAYFGEALVDLQVAAVGRKDGEADRCGVVDQSQCRLPSKRPVENPRQFDGDRSATTVL